MIRIWACLRERLELRRSMLVTRLPNRSTRRRRRRARRRGLGDAGCRADGSRRPSARAPRAACPWPASRRRAQSDRALRTCGSPSAARSGAPRARRPACGGVSRSTPSARRCPARRTDSRPPPRRCRAAPSRRRDRRPRGRWCRRERSGSDAASCSAPSRTSCGGDVVGDVDERDVGADPEDHALHRPGIVIARCRSR